MAVAAYASLVSLTHVLDNIHYRAQLHRLTLGVKQIETLQGKVRFLLHFVEAHSQSEKQGMESLWRKMAGVAREVEEMIDLHVVDELCRGSEECKSDAVISSFHQDMEGVLQKIDLIMKELSMVKEGTKDIQAGKQPGVSMPASSSMLVASSRNTMVGFDEYVASILDDLTSNEHNLQIIPIIGMGGVGKTTLAQNIFTHPHVVHHFDKCIWVTISQEYSIPQTLLSLLSEGEKEESGETLTELGERLHKKLLWRRYLIVMDDVWSTDIWDNLKMLFPNDRNGSRVMITTRLSNVARSLGCQNLYLVNVLNENQSWKLFCQTTFGQEYCPYPELKKIGKDIAKCCKGLPLALVVIAGLLLKSNMTREYWELVARNMNPFGNLEDGERCLKILSLSYTDLPIHLKLCFLYMRTFYEDEMIDVSNLIKLWVVEGFIKPVDNKSLEEIAGDYFNDLVSRNLIFVQEWTINKEPEACGVHDLLRDLCLRESSKESFSQGPIVQQILSYWRAEVCFVCGECLVTENETINFLDSRLLSPAISRVEALVCDACKTMYPHIARTRAVGVINFNQKGIRKKIVTPTRLRYLSISYVVNDIGFAYPPTLHLLWNLHTIIISPKVHTSRQIILPSEFWEMSQLVHFEVNSAILSDPPIHERENEGFMIMENLQTLSNMHSFKCTIEVLDRIPNLKALKVNYEIEFWDQTQTEWPKYFLCNLAQLSKLESLEVRYALAEEITFPKSLKKLVLSHYLIPWDNMTIIGALPCLEILELNIFGEGPKWNPVEGDFLQLKGLSISWSGLEWWGADAIHFPRLEWLKLKELHSLVEIPLSIGDIETLHTIEVESCSNAVMESAKRIWEEQRSWGNQSLQILFTEVDNWRQYQIGDFKFNKHRRRLQ